MSALRAFLQFYQGKCVKYWQCQMKRFLGAIEALSRSKLVDGVMTLGLVLGFLVYGMSLSPKADFYKMQMPSPLRAGYFTLSEIKITGLKKTLESDVIDYLGVSHKTKLPDFNTRQALGRVRVLPWVKSAQIQKLYPNKLVVHIEEVEPFALMQKANRWVVIAKDQSVISDEISQGLLSLPKIYGKNAQKEVASFLAKLSKYPSIRSRLEMLEYVGERRWTLHLENKKQIHLPEVSVEGALSLLSQKDSETNLLQRDFVVLDMRIQDKISLRLSDAVIAQHKEKNKIISSSVQMRGGV